MYTRILIPLDTSPIAEQVLSHVERLLSPTAAIHLVCVVEPNMYSYAFTTPEATVQEKLQAVIHTDMERYLARMEATLRDQGRHVTSWLARGDAAQSIVDVAVQVQADLIAMSTHGRSGFSRWAMGSVADRVIQTAQQPILLIRNQLMTAPERPLQRILVPVDGSPAAEIALAQARTIAQEQDAELLLVRVVEPLSGWQQALLAENGASTEEVDRARWHEAEAYIATHCTALAAAQVRASGRLFHGSAGHTLVNLLQQEAFDLVVMSTHGLSGYSRWVYGSVAGKVLHNTPCPLLLLRTVEVQKNRLTDLDHAEDVEAPLVA
jgi:nucleotide-binding universal stress UspA family protein